MMELLVVIAILCLAAGISGLSMALAFSRDAEKCARTIEESIEETRRSGMTMKGIFTFRLDTVSRKMEIVSSEKGQIMTAALPARVTVTLEAVGGTAVGTGNPLEIEFNKANGRVKSIKCAGLAVDGTMFYIHCDSGGRRVTVVLVRETGKHYLDYESG